MKGEEIPISAQVTALADVYDALTSVRCYKAAIPHEKAMEMILDGQCGAFNPLLLQCLKDVQYQVADAMRSDGAQEEPDRQAVLRTTEERWSRPPANTSCPRSSCWNRNGCARSSSPPGCRRSSSSTMPS